MARLRLSALLVVHAHLGTVVFLPAAVERLAADRGFFAGLWDRFFVRDAHFNLPQHRRDLFWLVPLDGHDPLFLQVDSLSFHLVQISPVTSHSPRIAENSVRLLAYLEFARISVASTVPNCVADDAVRIEVIFDLRSVHPDA